MTLLKNLFLVFVSGSGKALNESKMLKDEALVTQIVSSNNTLLFATLYDRYSQKVYNKCFSFSKSEDEAEDLTQDVFLKLFTKLHSFKGTSKFSTWLYAFTYNFCVNYVNRDKTRKMDDVSDSLNDHDFHLSNIEDVEDEDLFSLQVAELKIALKSIDPEDKAILLLKYQDDVSIKELQELLEAGESAIKMRLKRAKLRVIEEHNKIIRS